MSILILLNLLRRVIVIVLHGRLHLLLRNDSCCRVLAIKDNGDLFQGVTSSLGVREVDSNKHDEKYHNEHKVVLPVDSFKGNRVDKGVEENGDDS